MCAALRCHRQGWGCALAAPRVAECFWDMQDASVECRRTLAPHQWQELERIFEHRITVAARWKRHAVGARLGIEPADPHATRGPTAGEDVQRRDDLAEVRDVSIHHTGHERAETDLLRDRRQICERGVALQHVVPGRAEHRDLPEVIHDPDAREAGPLRGGCDRRQAIPDLGAAAGPRVHRYLKSELHGPRLGSLSRGERCGPCDLARRGANGRGLEYEVVALLLEPVPLRAQLANL